MNDINMEIQETPNVDMEVQEQADIEFNLSEVPSIIDKDYNNLNNKPSINNVTLQGNKTSDDLGLVAKETGKGLSTNDFTNALKSKLEGVEEGATKVEKTSDIENDSGFIDISVNNLTYYRTSSNQDVIDNEIKDDIDNIEEDVSNIEALIPTQATGQNQLADKNFVNSSVATNTAYFRGTFNIVTDLELSRNATHEQVATALESKITTITNNDYAFVAIPNETITTQIDQYDRYKYTSGTGWSYEFTLNNSSFTSNQWASINSGLSSNDKTKLDGIETNAEVNVLEGVKINGTELTITDKKVDIPVASNSAGVVKIGSVSYGMGTLSDGTLYTRQAGDNELVAKTNPFMPITSSKIDKAIMEGLGNNSLNWSDAYKLSARNTIGATGSDDLPNVVRL